MLECLISVVVIAIVALIILLVIEQLLAAFLTLDARIVNLLRLLFGLVVVLYALQCLGVIMPRLRL